MQCGVLCNISPFSQGVCDGDGFCVSQEMNPCAVYGCNGKKCGDDCLSGDNRGVCNADGECDFNVGSVIQSGSPHIVFGKLGRHSAKLDRQRSSGQQLLATGLLRAR